MHEIELARRLGLIQTPDYGPHELLQLLRTRIQTDYGLKINGESRTEPPFIICRPSGAQTFLNGTDSAEVTTRKIKIKWFHFGSNNRFGCDIQRKVAAFMRQVNFEEIAFTRNLCTLWNDDVAADATISYKQFIRKCWPLVNDRDNLVGDFMESNGTRRRQDSLALTNIHRELIEYAESSSVMTRGVNTFDGSIYNTSNNTADAADQTNQTSATPAINIPLPLLTSNSKRLETYKPNIKRWITKDKDEIEINKMLLTSLLIVEKNIDKILDKINTTTSQNNIEPSPSSNVSSSSSSSTSSSSTSSSSTSSSSSSTTSTTNNSITTPPPTTTTSTLSATNLVLKDLEQQRLNLRSRCTQRGICCCEKGLQFTTCFANSRSCSRNKDWRCDIIGIAPTDVNKYTKKNLMSLEKKNQLLTQQSQKVKKEEKQRYNKYHRTPSLERADILKLLKSPDGTWYSWVVDLACLAFDRKTDIAFGGVYIYIWNDSKNSLIKHKELPKLRTSNSLSHLTIFKYRSTFALANQMSGNVWNSVGHLKRIERKLGIQMGEIYKPAVELHILRIVSKYFISCVGGDTFAKNAGFDWINLAKKDSTTTKEEKELVLLSHHLEHIIHDKRRITEVDEIEGLSEDVINDAFDSAKEFYTLYSQAAHAASACSSSERSLERIKLLFAPAWDWVVSKTQTTYDQFHLFLVGVTSVDAVHSRPNVQQNGRNGQLVGFTSMHEKTNLFDVYEQQGEAAHLHQMGVIASVFCNARTPCVLTNHSAKGEKGTIISIVSQIQDLFFLCSGIPPSVLQSGIIGDHAVVNREAVESLNLEPAHDVNDSSWVPFHHPVVSKTDSTPDVTDPKNSEYFSNDIFQNKMEDDEVNANDNEVFIPADILAPSDLKPSDKKSIERRINFESATLCDVLPSLAHALGEVDDFINEIIPETIKTTDLLVSLGLLLRGQKLTKKEEVEEVEEEEEEEDEENENMNIDSGNLSSSDEESSDDEEMITSSEDENNENSESDDDENEDENEEENEDENEDEESDTGNDEDEDENSDTTHDGSPLTKAIVGRLRVVDLNFCLKTLKVKNRSKLKNKKEKQDALEDIIEQRNVFRPGNREEARINIHYFLTRNSPKDIDSLCTDQVANFSSYLVCSPHLAKALHSLVIRATSSVNPVLFLLDENNVDVIELIKELNSADNIAQQQAEDSAVAKFLEEREERSTTRAGRKRRKKTIFGDAAIDSEDELNDDIRSVKKKVEKTFTKEKEKVAQRKASLLKKRRKGGVTEEIDNDPKFARIGRDALKHAFVIKLLIINQGGDDPCPHLKENDTKNDSFLKMDVHRPTRFSSCDKYLYGLAVGKFGTMEMNNDFYAGLGLEPPSASRRLAFLAMSKYASLLSTIFVDFLMSYSVATEEKLKNAEKAATQLLLWHLHLDINFTGDRCSGAVVSKYQLEGMFGLLRTMRRFMTMGENARNEDGTGPQFDFWPGRECNSYVESRFSVFRNGLGSSVLDGASITYQWRTMMAREMRGEVRIAIERKDYSKLRKFVEKVALGKRAREEEEDI